VAKENNLINKILVPTDGSEPSNHAAEFAIKLGKKFNAEIIAVYVVDRLIMDEVSKVHEKRELEEEIKKKAERSLNYVVKSAEIEGLKASSVLLEGQPYDQIIQQAEALNVDMIVMGTTGRRGMERILIGSVAERVIEYAPCPVLVMK
jgi:nucleotide-binding universal stress UspA family protein